MKKKNVCILMGSPRKNGNTASLCVQFADELEKNGTICETFSLYDMKLLPCRACRACQKDWTIFGCSQDDDMQKIFDSVQASDFIVIATPIYSWYCTPPVKCVLDRLVYGMNKYYGDERGPALWAGKRVALIATCGYPLEKGADLFESGMIRYCKHSQLNYVGMFAERHLGYKTTFMDEEKELHARQFANSLMKEI